MTLVSTSDESRETDRSSLTCLGSKDGYGSDPQSEDGTGQEGSRSTVVETSPGLPRRTEVTSTETVETDVTGTEGKQGY